MNVISCFDGIGGAYQALKNLDIEVDNYLAFEVDKYAIQISKKNHPDIWHLGDIKKWQEYSLGNADLIIGGSPCQDLSIAGKRAGLKGERSGLFYVMADMIKTYRPKYFLVENVASMKKCQKDIISKELGVEPIMINSALVTAQNRKRLYWTNIPGIEQPEDEYIDWGDIREYGVKEKSMYYSEKALDWINKHSQRTGKKLKIHGNRDKMQMIEASHHKKYSAQRFFGIIDNGLGPGGDLRYITPLECERCQGYPDNYTEDVSNTQRYKGLGNAFTVDVIKHILSNIT